MSPPRLPAGDCGFSFKAVIVEWERCVGTFTDARARVYPTRLETRTKESSMCASRGGFIITPPGAKRKRYVVRSCVE